jgi:hypothetical protein
MKHTTPSRVDPPWRWLRVFYYEDCKDDLILDGIWPSVQAASGTAPPRAYFKRDWIGGPNVLIGVDTRADPGFDLQGCAAAIERYLAAHPSRRPVTPAEFAAWAQPYETWELQQESARTPLRPDNSAVVETTEPSSPLGYERELTHDLRGFLCDSAPFAIRWLGHVRDGSVDRQLLALSILVTLAWTVEPKQLGAHMSFRSHSESFFNGSPAGERLRPAFDRHYDRERAHVRAFIERTVAELGEGVDVMPGMQEFSALVRRSMTTLTDGLNLERYKAPDAREILTRLSQGNTALFQRVFERYQGLFSLLDTVPLFRAWQMTVNLTYLLLNQLGVRPIERFLACYLVTRTIEEMYGHRAIDLADLVAQTGDISSIIGFGYAKPGR